MHVIAKIAQVSYYCIFHTSFFIFADIMIVIKNPWTNLKVKRNMQSKLCVYRRDYNVYLKIFLRQVSFSLQEVVLLCQATINIDVELGSVRCVFSFLILLFIMSK